MIDTSGDAGRTKGSEYARVFESTQKVSPSSNELMDAYQVLKQAQTILGPISRPFNKGSAPYRKTPIEAVRIELDLQKTMEASMVQGKGVEIWQSYEVPKKTALNFCIDTSLSMTGEKLFHTAVALAVALLQFRDCPAAVMSFENENFFHLVPSREYSILHVLRSFLRSPM